MVQLTVCLDSGGEKPLYQQLYESLVSQIWSGALKAGDRLPGKRALAGQLAVAVNTVDTAYQMLAAEGYLEARQRSGFFVLESGGFPAVEAPALPHRPAADAPQEQEDEEEPCQRFDLSTGGVDTALFPFRTWGRIQRDLLYGEPELLRHGHRQGDENLRRELAEYLRAYRGVDCGVEQIVVGAGVEYLLGLVARLLGPVTAAVENPGYDRSRMILENSGVRCRCVSIDEGGLSAEGLEASGADLCYVTPSHHFPTAVTMPVSRRAQLLRWARQRPGRYILEDDYDAEFRFDTRPLPSLQGMGGRWGPVIYLCTFPRAWRPASVLPAWCCLWAFWGSTRRCSAATPTPSAALSSRLSAAFCPRATSPAISPGCAACTGAGWPPWRRLWRRPSAGKTSSSRAVIRDFTCC